MIKDLLPEFLYQSKLYTNILEASQSEIDILLSEASSLLYELIPNQTTHLIDKWEELLGIKSDTSKSIEQRRSVVVSKLRGFGTVNESFLENVANSYDCGEVDIIPDNENYKFKVKFISALGIPENIDDLKQIIEEVKPAHLGVEYLYKYLLVKDINQMTIAELNSTPINLIT